MATGIYTKTNGVIDYENNIEYYTTSYYKDTGRSRGFTFLIEISEPIWNEEEQRYCYTIIGKQKLSWSSNNLETDFKEWNEPIKIKE